MKYIKLFLLIVIVSSQLSAFKKLRKIYEQYGLQDYEIDNAKTRYKGIFSDLDDQLSCEGLLEENMVLLILYGTGLKSKLPNNYKQLKDDLHDGVRNIINEHAHEREQLIHELNDWLKINLNAIACCINDSN